MPDLDELDQLLDGSTESPEPEDEEIEDEEEEVDPETGLPLAPLGGTPPEPEAEAQPETEKPVTARREYASPYAAGRWTPAEQEEANALFDERAQHLINVAIDRGVAQALQADRQTRSVAESTGLTSEFMREYDIDRFMPFVDPAMKGTQQGVIIATQLAIGEKVANGADYAEELEKAARLMKGVKATPAAPAPRQPVRPLAPAAVVSRGSVNGVGGPASQQRSSESAAERNLSSALQKVGL